MNNNSTSVQLFNFLIGQGYTDQEARELIKRRNAYRETAKDKAAYKHFIEYLRATGKGEA